MIPVLILRLSPGQEQQNKFGLRVKLEICTKAQEKVLPLYFSAGLYQRFTCRSMFKAGQGGTKGLPSHPGKA